MDRHSPCLTPLWIALGAAGLLYAGIAQAIPEEQDPLLSPPPADLPAPVALPDGHTPETADPALVTEYSEPEAEPVAADNGAPATAIPCMQGVSADPETETAEACAGAGAATHQTPLAFRLGQRIGVNSGILDTYDGIRVDYRLNNGLTLNALAGYLDAAGQGSFNSDRRVLAMSADSARLAGAWDMNSFYIQRQDDAGILNRAFGGALRYLRPRRSMLVFVDYDINSHALGAFTATGAWTVEQGTTLSTTFDVRNSPIRKRQQNYLQRSMATATEGWNWSPPADRIYHFTNGRSDEVTTLAISLSHTFSERLKLTGSAAVLDVAKDRGGDRAAAGPEQPSEYFYNLKLAGRGLVLSDDSNMLDLRHSITGSARVSSASFDTRYAINRAWNINPRLRTDYRDDWLSGTARWVTSPTVKMEYRREKHYGFQIEAGGEWTSEETTEQDKGRSSYFLSLGYQANF